ncbi:MAG: hypothetical protein PVI13_02590 [Desulfobacterales bacterium]|jgi:hypothetical protein
MQNKENHFSWWMPTYITLLVMGSFILTMKERQSWAVHLIFWAILLFSSQMLDKSRWHGIFVEVAIEENMEFGAAILILMILLKFPIKKA